MGQSQCKRDKVSPSETPQHGEPEDQRKLPEPEPAPETKCNSKYLKRGDSKELGFDLQSDQHSPANSETPEPEPHCDAEPGLSFVILPPSAESETPEPEPEPHCDAEPGLSFVILPPSAESETPEPESHCDAEPGLSFVILPPSAERVYLCASCCWADGLLRTPETQLDSIFMLLEDNIVTFMKKEQKKIQKVLNSDDPECSESHWEDEEVLEGEDEEQRSIKRELLKNTVFLLRKMKQEELAECLQINDLKDLGLDFQSDQPSAANRKPPEPETQCDTEPGPSSVSLRRCASLDRLTMFRSSSSRTLLQLFLLCFVASVICLDLISKGYLGKSVLLPILLSLEVDVLWRDRSDQVLLDIKQGEPNLGTQDVTYKGRVSSFQNQYQNKNYPILLGKLEKDDAGDYKCTIVKPK